MFDFFGLSRELRDLVYKDSLVPEKCLYHGYTIHFKVNRFAAADLLLVSRQFGDEYRQSASKHTGLTFIDVAEEDIPEADVSCLTAAIPKALRCVRSAHFKLWLTCDQLNGTHTNCHTVDELNIHLNWMHHLISKALTPRVVSVALYMDKTSQVDNCASFLHLAQKQLARLPGLCELVVAVADTDVICHGPASASVVLKWDRKLDLLVRVDGTADEIRLDAVPLGAHVELSSDDEDEDEE